MGALLLSYPLPSVALLESLQVRRHVDDRQSGIGHRHPVFRDISGRRTPGRHFPRDLLAHSYRLHRRLRAWTGVRSEDDSLRRAGWHVSLEFMAPASHRLWPL